MSIKRKIQQALLRCRRCLKNASGFFSVSGKELCWLAFCFIFLLIINYFLFALQGFSLSYAKTLPDISVLGGVFFIQLFLFAGHFIFLRSRWYLWSVLSIHFLVLFILLGIYLTTGTFFCESLLVLVYDTTASEAAGFFSAYVKFREAAVLLLTAAGYFLLMHFASKLSCRHKKYCRGDVFILLLIAVVLLIPLVKIRCSSGGETAAEIFRSHPFAGICRQIALFNEHAGEFTVEMRHRTPPENVSLAPAFQSDHPVGILVIGESSIRGHHSIYGYSRETTPALSAEKENIVLFDDVITVLPMTVTALKYFLTDMTLENRHLSWTLFDALKQAGYRIDVITNQNKSGWADSPLQMIFASADSVTYMHEENFSDLKEDAGAEVYDELLLPEAAQRLAEIRESRDDRRPRLVVIHLFGNHEPYASRYPEDFSRKFLDDRSYPQLVNEYDTGILYTDMILGKLLAGLKQIDRPGYLIYFSDHGSVCDPENLRTPGSVNNSAYEIPFLVWTNESYRRSVPELMARMERRRSVPLQADMAHYGLLEIMGVDFAAETGKHNFLSDGFAAPERTVLEGKKPYRKGGGNE